MSAELIALVVRYNASDLETIIAKVGIGTLIAIIPNIAAILKTVQTPPKEQ